MFMAEVFVIIAMEMCVGSVHYDLCVDWMVDCQAQEMVKAQRWTVDDGAERCIETLPDWLSEGM